MIQFQSEGLKKGEPRIDSYGYVHFKLHGHHLCDSQDYVREHRLIVEQTLKCSLLPWSDVHHKNGIKTDNRAENLEAMTRSRHAQIHKPVIIIDRYCIFCGNNVTTHQNIHISGKDRWYRCMDGFACHACFKKFKRGTL